MRSAVPYWVLVAFALLLKLELLRDGAFTTWQALGALVVAIALLFIAKAVLDRTVFARCDTRPVPVWAVAVVGLGLGVVSVAPFVGAVIVGQGGVTEAPFMALLVSGAVRCAGIFPLVTYVVGLREWYRITRDRAERDLVRAQAARMETGDAVESTRGLIIEAARRELGPSQREAAELLRAAARSEAPVDASRAAESLRGAARSAVRSASHELWVDGGSSVTIRWRSIVPSALVRHPLPLLVAEFITLGTILVRADLVARPGLAAFAGAFAAMAILAAIYLCGRVVIHRLPRLAMVVTALAVVGGPVAGQVASSAILGRSAVPLSLIAGVIAIAIVTVASSVVLMIRDSGAAVIQALVDDRAQADAEQAALELMNGRLSRELATHLHGTVQPQLLAASTALDAAVEKGDPAGIAEAVAQAEAALGMGVQLPPANDGAARSVADVEAGVRSRWQAMLDLQLDIDAPPDSRVPTGLVRVLDECLNNALVHGHATRARVVISATDGAWLVQVADDGIGPAGGAPGLGSALLDDITRGQWSLGEGPDGGALVRAEIPDRAPTPAG